MARLPRIVVPGQALHIIQRGNNRQPCFFADEDYRYYLDCLKDTATRFGGQLHAYVLMTNHMHLLLTPEFTATPAMILQSVGRRYVRYINQLYRRSGTLIPPTTPCSRARLERKPEIIVSGDRHLLDLKEHQGVRTVVEAVRILGSFVL